MNLNKCELLHRMKRIRALEEAIADHYADQQMRCPTHLSIGQELVGAIIGMTLRQDDFAVSSHRGHAHYIGKGGNLKAMISELYGKVSGCARGRGGSMHLIDQSVGFMGTTAIVGNSIPVGVGLGLSIKLDGDDRISCVFLGDGCIEEGVFYESANFSVVKNLPVLFICENNLYSVYSPLSVRQPNGRKIHEVAEAIGLKAYHEEGTDVEASYNGINAAIEHVRAGFGPAFIEISAYRWREHCGPNFDNHLSYRSEKEFLEWKERDPLICYEKFLLECKELDEVNLKKIEQQISAEVNEAFEYAKDSEFPDVREAYTNEYSEN